VLVDRGAGRAAEPAAPESEVPPPASPNPYFLAITRGLFGFGLMGAFISKTIVDYYENPDTDQPQSFGSKIAWLALNTTDTSSVATALHLAEIRDATWADGIAAAYRASIFVTPPVAEWTLVAGVSLFPAEPIEALIKPMLERLSEQFGEAQYCCTHRDAGLHVWARAHGG